MPGSISATGLIVVLITGSFDLMAFQCSFGKSHMNRREATDYKVL